MVIIYVACRTFTAISFFCFAAQTFHFCYFYMFEINENKNLSLLCLGDERFNLDKTQIHLRINAVMPLSTLQPPANLTCRLWVEGHPQRSLDLRVKPGSFLLAIAPTTELPRGGAQLIDSYICVISYLTGNNPVPRFSHSSVRRQSVHVTIVTWHGMFSPYVERAGRRQSDTD